jgi:hypothetical protein
MMAVVGSSSILRTSLLLTDKGDVYILEPGERQFQSNVTNLGDRDYFQGVLKTGKTSWSDVNISTSDGSALASVGMPIKDKNGKLSHVVTGSLQFSVMNETAALVDLGPESAVMLFDKKGVPIV